MAGRTWLVELPQATCVELLTQAMIGRLGVVIAGKPEVFPVCHVYLDGFVTFPTNSGTKMHAALEWPWVAFEVDEIDPDGLRGRSVMVSGRAEEVTDPAVIERAAAMRTAPWRTQAGVRWVRIVAEQVTGREIDVEMPLTRGSGASW
jgi:nitroimidazol reductase NimA-like FMN-containing flavoprotein (pyridoxamine 5'-phosphate oxidase superfamily)